MSKIFDLIKRFCPQGVEFRELGEICKFSRGKSLSKSDKDLGDIPMILYGELYTTYGDYINKIASYTSKERAQKASIAIFGDLILPISSTTKEAQIGKVSALMTQMPVYIGGDTLILSHNQNPGFLVYYLNSKKFEKEKMKCVSGTTVTHLSPSKLAKIKLPVPPLEVQREIVRILDCFTLLTAELTAELTARKKQYEFYRDHLLNFDKVQEKIEWMTIENVFIMKNGYTPSKANKDFWENGTIPWFRMEDIRENGRILSDSIQKITPQAVKGGKLIPKNSIIVATTATIGEHALAIADSFLMNQRFTSFTIHELLKDKLDAKFVFYYFFKICEWCKQNTNSSSFPSVDMAKLKNVKFPIPPKLIQHKIVEILDKFDTLVNSISEGLPREIKLRRKQYEYYREKLLNFTEIKKEI